MSDWIKKLGSPAKSYFTVWLIVQAATVGLLLGWIAVEPRMWWRNLLSVAEVLIITGALYHVFLWLNRGFDWIDKRIGAATGDTER